MGGWYLGYRDEVVHYNLSENQFKQGWTLCGRSPRWIFTLLEPCFFIGYDFCERCLDKVSKIKGEKYKFEWVDESWERDNWVGKYSFDWADISKSMRMESEYRCEGCGLKCWSSGDPRLVVHHIDRNTRNDEAENLIVLCTKCHMERHFKKGWRYDA